LFELLRRERRCVVLYLFGFKIPQWLRKSDR
jgi:hypothetical protein